MSDDSERLWNLMVYKMPVTDAELGEMMPFMLPLLVILIIIVGSLYGCSKLIEKDSGNVSTEVIEVVQ